MDLRFVFGGDVVEVDVLVEGVLQSRRYIVGVIVPSVIVAVFMA
jgi:hypothetical protein